MIIRDFPDDTRPRSSLITPNFVTKHNITSLIINVVDKYEIKDCIMNLIPRIVDLFFFNSAKALIPRLHMMTALVISAEIIYFATKHGQSPINEATSQRSIEGYKY